MEGEELTGTLQAQPNIRTGYESGFTLEGDRMWGCKWWYQEELAIQEFDRVRHFDDGLKVNLMNARKEERGKSGGLVRDQEYSLSVRSEIISGLERITPSRFLIAGHAQGRAEKHRIMGEVVECLDPNYPRLAIMN